MNYSDRNTDAITFYLHNPFEENNINTDRQPFLVILLLHGTFTDSLMTILEAVFTICD